MEKRTEISLDQAFDLFSNDDIERLQKAGEQSSFVQLIGYIVVAVLFSLPATNYFPLFSVINGVLDFGLLFWYSMLPPYRQPFLVWFFRYLILQSGMLAFLIVFLNFPGDMLYWWPVIYIGVSTVVVALIIWRRMRKALVVLRETGNLGAIKQRWLDVYLAGFVLYLFSLMYYYRATKWFHFDFGLISQLGEYAVLLIILVSLTLTPLLLCDEKELVKDIMLRRYSEQFRELFGMSRSQWYD
ncbi:MAG: hypothetical protein LKJ69_04795 [Lactobacillus sp.]|jgi:hypothetical protein|nr:hypothetical protein [Lactobacillus sp.]MCI2032701.1 hypothetical protein [Lactobacillus sp.]